MKQFIKNRKNQNICVVVEGLENTGGFAVVMHGLGGFKEQLQIRTIIETFLKNGMKVLSFDTTNTFGESDGTYEDATVTNYYEDLEDVISWAEEQSLYEGKIYLTGTSLGGICTGMYAQKFPEKIKALAPVSTVVTGQLTVDEIPKDQLEHWKTTGYKIKESVSKPGVIKKLKRSHIEDRIRYSLLEKVNVFDFPVMLIVGDNDTTTPVQHQEILFDKIPSEKQLHIIKGGPHTFSDPKHLSLITKYFDEWIKKIEK